MTYTRQKYPDASCFLADTYGPGQGSQQQWIVTTSQSSSAIFSAGISEALAWERAAHRVLLEEKNAEIAELRKELLAKDTDYQQWLDHVNAQVPDPEDPSDAHS